MPFSNKEYLYNHLPSRFRRDDKDLFLKRYLQFFGETLDDYDDKFDSFFESIDPATASEEFIDFWLENLFGWSWFPKWFTVADKRTLYANFAHHLARRGTRRGIELWLADFRVHARVITRPIYYGEWVWGEPDFYVADPLLILIEVLYAEMEHKTEMFIVGEAVWGETAYIENEPLFTPGEFNALLRYVQPIAQEILFFTKLDSKPKLADGYTNNNFAPAKNLNQGDELTDLLGVAMTATTELNSFGKLLPGYTGDYTTQVILDRDSAQLEDAINVLMTAIAYYFAGNSFAAFTFQNFDNFNQESRIADGDQSQLAGTLDYIKQFVIDLKRLGEKR